MSPLTRAAFLRRAAAAGLLATAGPVLAAGSAGAATTSGYGRRAAPAPRRAAPALRGVAYDTGTEFLGASNRPLWTGRHLATDLRAIDEGLHCTWVSVFGSELDRLVQAATGALRRGLAVSIQPRLFDRPQEEFLDLLARTARHAERLRRRHRPEVILVIGCEFMLFTPGIVPGETFFDRVRYLGAGGFDLRELLGRLEEFIGRALAVARRHFHGRVSYAAAAGLEEIDWSRFDLVGLDYYDFHADPARHAATLDRYRRWGRPIVIMEFGSCTYEGAPERGGMGWDIVDWDGPLPEIVGDPVRSERVQAEHLATMLDVFAGLGLYGASPYTFVAPDLPHSEEPRHDLDVASYALVKVIRRDLGDPASPYFWLPKLAFHAVARHYARRSRDRSANSAHIGRREIV